jgi:two-component system chemotaxis sensor kinase CheA
VDKDKLLKRLMATFLEELEEHVGALNRELLALEKEADPARRAELLQTLFRSAHSLKGAARSVNVGLIESACHQMEDILSEARDGGTALAPEVFSLLFATADAIEEAGMRLREQQDLSGAPLAAMLPRLEAAAAGQVPVIRGEESGGKDNSSHSFHAGLTLRRIHESETNDTNEMNETNPPPAPGPSPHYTGARGEPGPDSQLAGSVRVASEKLDAFLARAGELLVARQRVQSRAEDVIALRESVGRWAKEWRRVEKGLRKWLDKDSRDGGEAAGRGPNGRPSQSAAAVLGRTGERLRQLEKDLDRLYDNMARDRRQLKHAAEGLDGELRRVRMLPFAGACQGLDRMVRDLAQSGGKEVELVVEGGEVELDRSVLEGLKDPLRHLIRNAVDHGAESADERGRAGKPPHARVTVTAAFRGTHVAVEVADDGRGLDLDALRQQLRRRNLPEPADERDLARAIFLPGLSTSRLVTDVSGRGVGLDVVKSRVEALHGTVDVTFSPGRGTRFALAVPLTLTTLRALLVGVGGQTLALAGTSVQKLVRVGPADLATVAGRDMLRLGDAPLPVAGLAETLGLTPRAPATAAARRPAVIVAAGERRMAFVVDEFIAEREVVIKNLGSRLRRVPLVSGATILPSGKIALVLNAANLIRAGLARGPAAAVPAAVTPPAKRRILVADDSVTTRTLEKSILEAAGYEVLVAADGAAAWRLLQERGADLLVSDIEMPRMDGLALAEAVRASPRFRELPIVLVTARASEEDRARGARAGADAYLVKSAFDQKNLLETIAQLL